ncbi:hypothetical protein, partial [Burkholderia ubonensis]|uniref:hypothetical protein n=1 Tax=Burkholderia ubonensis TaxID=101571 RepID=UPI001C8A2439
MSTGLLTTGLERGMGEVFRAPVRPEPFPSLEMQKPPPFGRGFLSKRSLTITYFHTGIRTIIGVESFHGPVR